MKNYHWVCDSFVDSLVVDEVKREFKREREREGGGERERERETVYTGQHSPFFCCDLHKIMFCLVSTSVHL